MVVAAMVMGGCGVKDNGDNGETMMNVVVVVMAMATIMVVYMILFFI